MTTLVVNGTQRQTAASTVEELAVELDPAPQTLLIEHNQKALHRSEWPAAVLSENDRLEILKISAGG